MIFNPQSPNIALSGAFSFAEGKDHFSRQENPFPGLRPFRQDESDLFFGRENQVNELLRRLQINQFLAVVGTSGSGKSSLVAAGLLPALYSGAITKAGSRWLIATMRPGDSPIKNLAHGLSTSGILQRNGLEPAMEAMVIETTLRRSSLGFTELFQSTNCTFPENLLIVVDQFEELFRFRQRISSFQASDEAAAFVKLLLAAVNHPKVYVLLTMRSDFLGDCAQFRDFPELLNDNQYLIPRMTRNQRRQAIEGPIAVGGGTITPRLVNQLLNDVGNNPDQLPVLQHALMRTWDMWKGDHQPEEAIDLRHYETIGSMANALSKHADEIYGSLGKDIRLRNIAKVLFKRLTEKDSDNRGIRHPTHLGEICDIAEAATPEEVIAVVEKFRAPGCSFLMPPVGVELTPDTILDISHESLMRGWKMLKEWIDEEYESAETYRDLAKAASKFSESKASLLQEPELEIYLNWQQQENPNAVWAERYRSDSNEIDVNNLSIGLRLERFLDKNQRSGAQDTEFDRAIAFLDKSKLARDNALDVQRKKRRNLLIRTGVLLTMVLFAALASITAIIYGQNRRLDKQNSQLDEALVERDRTIQALEKTRSIAEEANQDLETLTEQLPKSGDTAAIADAVNEGIADIQIQLKASVASNQQTLEELVSNRLSQEDAQKIIEDYLNSRKNLLGPEYSGDLAQYRIDRTLEKIQTSQQWLKDNNAYYTYENIELKESSSFISSEELAVLEICIVQDYIYHQEGEQPDKRKDESRWQFTLKSTESAWKVSNRSNIGDCEPS
ncbi:MAG: IMS domain-containing protein [Cyanobacteria bacterium P01_D01_bin.56]